MKETPDGVVLVRCFSGCAVGDVLAAVGLEFDALFPENASQSSRPERRPWSARDVLEVMADEAELVAIEGARMANGTTPTPDDLRRVLLAVQRLRSAAEVCRG